METPNGSSNGSKAFWWILGLVTTGAVGISTATITNSKDIAGLKENHQGTRESIIRIEKEMERMNNKLDRVLEKK